MKVHSRNHHFAAITSAFTLAEVMISLAISSLLIGGILYGYALATKRSEWSAYSLAANALALQRMEQVRSSKYDSSAAIDEVVTANFPTTIAVLDTTSAGIPVKATNYTTIALVSVDPPLKSIQVDCVWYFAPRQRLFTNTLVTYRAPE
ncbi:MAG: hypothetical protein ABJC04_07365 [Verrucomicrobiota bacterium]